MKIAFLGIRGVPANYSGFEKCAEELGYRLVQRGHKVYVYCRTQYIDFATSMYKGMHLIKFPTIQNKYLDTFYHTCISTIHALLQHFDILLYFNVGNSPLTLIPTLLGKKNVLNVDGLDWKRDKWGQFAKMYIQLCEYLATKFPHVFITDSRVVQSYYQKKFGIKPFYIPYGSEVEIRTAGENLKRFGLKPQKYILFVGRLVPENCVHHLIEAYNRAEVQDYKCVIVGDAPYAEEYKSFLRELAKGNPNIVFTGYVFGDGYSELGSNAWIFVETSHVGGTHPALIEAMAFGNCVVVNNTEENLETIGDAGFYYEGNLGAESLTLVLKELLKKPDLVLEYRNKAKNRAKKVYSWESVTDDYEHIFQLLIDNHLSEE
jgi:glycosyltransferase involved in cell wall biosynthesis